MAVELVQNFKPLIDEIDRNIRDIKLNDKAHNENKWRKMSFQLTEITPRRLEFTPAVPFGMQYFKPEEHGEKCCVLCAH